MENIYVFGHKNPDTDTVTASISLSYLKNQLGINTIPKILGSVNNETKFVLDYFNVEEPLYLNDVKLQIRDIKYHKGFMINEYKTIKDFYDYITEFAVTGSPVVDDNNKLLGLVTLKIISKYIISDNINSLYTSYDNILRIINGKEVLKFVDEINGNIIILPHDKFNSINKDSIVITDSYNEDLLDAKMIIFVNYILHYKQL